ncbi:spore coat protein, CotS family [Clostridium acetobutylicum]|nr:spore coat protein, CotS family [Clostridium acetobutylicum]
MIEKTNPSHILLPEDSIKKYILPKYNLQDAEILQIKFKDTEKQRAVYKLTLGSKKYCLKKVYYDKGELLFVYSTTEWFFRHGINVTRILPTLDNSRFVIYSGMIFILMPWIDGLKCNYDKKENLFKASKNLAHMHRCSQKFFSIQGSSIRYGFEHIYLSNKKHFEQILSFFNKAYEINDSFSKIALNNCDLCIKLSKIALNASSRIESRNFKKSLCHLDYVNKNIIFDKNNDIWVIDFDKCKFDYSVHDISYFMRRIMKRDNTRWNSELLINMLNVYEQINPLNLDEYLYILSYLVFPQKFWKICKDYYNNLSRCNKAAFINLIKSTTKYSELHLKFAYNFSNYIEGKFNVSLNL